MENVAENLGFFAQIWDFTRMCISFGLKWGSIVGGVGIVLAILFAFLSES